MTPSAAATLVLAAHGAGILLTREPTWRERLLFRTAVAVPVAAIAAVAVVRAVCLEE